MFLLPSASEPGSLPDLRRLWAKSLEQTFGVSEADQRLVIEGKWPELDRVKIDLTGARIDPLDPPVAPSRLTSRDGAGRLHSDRFQFSAQPIHLGAQGELRFLVEAGGVDFSFVRDDRERLWLLPHHVASGQATVTIAGRDLERVFLESAQRAAAEHGVSIEGGSLELHQAVPREVRVEARLVARKLFVKSRLRLEGRVTIDEQLNIHFSDLAVEGQGVVGALACKFLRPHLEEIERQPLPLLAIAFPAVRLHEASLNTDAQGQLVARAEFGEGE